MSIAPPSDIVLDVAQAADPAKRQAAVERLAALAAQGGSPPVDFDAALKTATPSAGATRPHGVVASRGLAPDGSLRLGPLQGAPRPQVTAGHGTPYQKFEAMVLQSFVASILPKDTELFGDSASADMCRSMLAEKLADQLARSGRIGIAKQLEAHAATAGAAPAKPPQG